jgi:protein-S-isoprenylcysteine O-methyltransferase Ste14
MSSHRRNIAISILFTVFGGPGILLLYLPLWFTHLRIPTGEPVWGKLLAGALIVTGLAPLLESIVRFIHVGRGTLAPTEATEHLVVSGLYRHVRNPMYLGVLAVLAGEACLFWSRGLAIEAAAVCLGIHLFVHLYEEPTLARRYPEEYPRYKSHVPRWLPRLKPWNGPQA